MKKTAAHIIASLAQNSKKLYMHSLKQANNFIVHTLEEKLLPCKTQALDLSEQGYAHTTIRTHISAINFLHKVGNYPSPGESFMIKKVLTGLGKQSQSFDKRLPITMNILEKLTTCLNVPLHGNTYLSTMLKAMFSLAFHAFLRVGEITTTKGANHNIQLSQISKSKEGIKISLKNFKHAPLNHTTTLLITPTHKETCPVVLLTKYLEIRPKILGPLFIFKDDTPVSRNYFSKCLQNCLDRSGLTSKYYRSHSFRIGAATHAAATGISDTNIMRMCRWKSQGLLKYIRMPVLNK